MKEIFESHNVEIISAIVSLGVTLVTTIVAHLLGNSKLLYTEKVKIIGELSQKKYEGITKIRSEIRILGQYENLCITEEEENLIPENIGGKQYTPAACYSYEKLSNVANVLNDLYGEYGYCLRHTSVIQLIYIRNFLMDYMMKCFNAGLPEDEMRWASVPLYNGIHKWYKMFDKELIRSMNRPSTKYHAHSGLIYGILLKVYGFYFKRTFPYKYMNDEHSLFNMMINKPEEIIEQYEEIILENSEELQKQ